jgi:hypothetical protein
MTNASQEQQADPWNQSLFELKSGERDEALNKVISEMVLVTEDFVVYIASDLSIQWRTTDHYEWQENSGAVLNKVAILETRSRFIQNPTTLLNIRRQIAEGLARCFDQGKSESAMILLQEVELEIQIRNKEISWDWYFKAAHLSALACGVAIITLWVARIYFRELLGSTAFDLAIGTFCGAIGALLSITSRGNRLHLDANSGKWIHQLEALSRIGAGLAGAAFIALAIKGGLILGGTQFAGSKFSLLLAFCIGAGSSERLIPNLIANLEQVTGKEKITPIKRTKSASAAAKKLSA